MDEWIFHHVRRWSVLPQQIGSVLAAVGPVDSAELSDNVRKQDVIKADTSSRAIEYWLIGLVTSCVCVQLLQADVQLTLRLRRFRRFRCFRRWWSVGRDGWRHSWHYYSSCLIWRINWLLTQKQLVSSNSLIMLMCCWLLVINRGWINQRTDLRSASSAPPSDSQCYTVWPPALIHNNNTTTQQQHNTQIKHIILIKIPEICPLNKEQNGQTFVDWMLTSDSRVVLALALACDYHYRPQGALFCLYCQNMFNVMMMMMMTCALPPQLLHRGLARPQSRLQERQLGRQRCGDMASRGYHGNQRLNICSLWWPHALYRHSTDFETRAPNVLTC